MSTFNQKCTAALEAVRQAQADKKTWTQASNELYGIGGKLSELFPDVSNRTKFTTTEEFTQINAILAELMQLQPATSAGVFPAKSEAASGKLNIRIPKSIHAALQLEAEAENVSLNQLIVAKLACQLGELVRR